MQRKKKEIESPNRVPATTVKKKRDVANIPYSHVVKVRKHRTKKDTYIIESVLMIEDGCRIVGKRSHRTSAHPPINFKLEISEDDLHRLFSYAVNNNSDFSGQVSLVLADAIEQTNIGARGKHKGRETAMFHIKIEAGLLYLLFSELCGKSLKICPPFFQRLIDRTADYKAFIEVSGQPYPVMLTAYCLEEYYGNKHLASLGLNPFFSDGFSHFLYTYIKPQLAMCKNMFSRMLVYKGVTHLKKMSTGEVFAYTPLLAARDDMTPCDMSGNVLNPWPKKELSEEIYINPPFADIFKALGLI